MRVYFDVSCLTRPFDDQNQLRIRLEAEAINTILEGVDKGHWSQVSSGMADLEVSRISDQERRRQVHELLQEPGSFVKLSAEIFSRATFLEQLGFKPADAVHVAAAEAGQADVLLSCDNRLCGLGQRHGKVLRTRVMNPLVWLEELKNGPNP